MRHTIGHKNPTSEICQCCEQTSQGKCTTLVVLPIEYPGIQIDRSSRISPAMARMLDEAASIVDELSIMEEVCGFNSCYSLSLDISRNCPREPKCGIFLRTSVAG
jgi:hypothetical protein